MDESNKSIATKLLNDMAKLSEKMLGDAPPETDTRIVASLPCTSTEAELISMSTTVAGILTSNMTNDQKLQLLLLELALFENVPNIRARMMRLSMKTHKLANLAMEASSDG